ncbi:potassium transporter TrkA [Nonomuraea sp. NN258]|uniref:potassium transporter TrkA n=1 Tax=Nonomuraea antri TaxID=2730852 RepID=UPI0015696D90|nr:potassium transporter TrkA [Nonomuraea antri]NRQ32614.1 potassium transporter TrkA [Nonomuraea antri]
MLEEHAVLTRTPPSVRDGPTLVVIGTGGLARGLCYALATVTRIPLTVVVVGRDQERAAEVRYVSAARAALAGAPVRFRAESVDLSNDDALAELLSRLAPEGLLLAASSQSPWERTTAPSAWTSLVSRAGFGLTLPFQAELTLRAGRALAAVRPSAWFVNACFPDAVNPVLAASGVPVLCGIGNAGLLATSLQAALDLPDQRRLHVLAHHVHLHAPHGDPDETSDTDRTGESDKTGEVLAWLDGEPVAEPGELLAAQRAADRAELNHVTGLSAATLVLGLLSGARTHTSVPGPLGLPGGYPVLLDGAGLELRLPAGWSVERAVAFNQRCAARDGVVVTGDRITFTGLTPEEPEKAPNTPAELDLPADFPITELHHVTGRLHQLRARLRDRPPSL